MAKSCMNCATRSGKDLRAVSAVNDIGVIGGCHAMEKLFPDTSPLRVWF